jgi:prepilin-type N-terminal cleavage/methylation domain-containing protein
MRQRITRTRNTHGFTMVEMIIAVAVISILATLSAPALFEFLRQRDVRTEDTTLQEVNRALEAYLKAGNPLPDDTVADPTPIRAVAANNHWSTLIAPFGKLSAADIRTDTWGNPRQYVRFVRQENYLGATIPINYAMVLSRGPDREAAAATGIAVTGTNYAAITNGAWWRNQATDALRIQRFAETEPGRDDILIRMTDYADKVARYERTLQRQRAVLEALDTYSKQKYAEAIVAGIPDPERFIYYPRANINGAATDNAAFYQAAVNTDLTIYNGGNAVLSGPGSDDITRRTHMINLMRILGLPDDHCCSALETIAGNPTLEIPFFYASNPRPRLGGGACGARPDPRDNNGNGVCDPGECDLTLPPRLTIVADANFCG